MEWTIPAFSFPAEPGLIYWPQKDGKAELAWVITRDVNTRVLWIPRPEPSIPGPDRDPKGLKQTHLRRVG